LPHYKLIKDSTQHKFLTSQAKIRLFGGGFGNGKTAAMCIDALQVARDYPGANILAFRSTYPKLNDTLRKEFLKWCPKSWIERMPTDSDNTCILKNGTTINFRYVAQQGRNTNSEGTSNLLSATYDHIFGDQIEDPEITEKDLFDLLGRLRGNTDYVGSDSSRPRTGPRTLALSCNPTRNWVWRKLVRPAELLAQGVKSPDLLVHPVTGAPLVEVFNSGTYENVHNVGWDYIHTLEGVYTGQMRDRFLLGKWIAYEGLVYPDFSFTTHVIAHDQAVAYYHKLRRESYIPTILEAYDHGIARPSCYLFAFTDNYGNTIILDGFYKAESTVDWCARRIETIRNEYKVQYLSDEDSLFVYADPNVFRRTSGNAKTIGVTVAEMFSECGISMRRGNNDIANGIVKVRAALAISNAHKHPISGNFGAPHLFVTDNCPWWVNEVTDYMWKKATDGAVEDVPRDINDHAMDATKYLLTSLPSPARGKHAEAPRVLHGAYFKWHEQEAATRNSSREHRYH